MMCSDQNAHLSLVYSYSHAFTGFSAVMSKEQATTISGIWFNSGLDFVPWMDCIHGIKIRIALYVKLYLMVLIVLMRKRWSCLSFPWSSAWAAHDVFLGLPTNWIRFVGTYLYYNWGFHNWHDWYRLYTYCVYSLV